MDLSTVTEVLIARSRQDLTDPRPGDAFLSGGTALFGQPNAQLRRLIDLTALSWPAATVSAGGLDLAATCTVEELLALDLPADWLGAAAIGPCCRAFLASFKIHHKATVGGNICVSYPAGPMISLVAALDGSVLVWRPDGTEYSMQITDFILGDELNALEPGEVLRSILLPAAALRGRIAFRKLALAPLGRSSAVILARSDGDEVLLTITASSTRPYVLRLPAAGVADLVGRIDAAVAGNWVDDVYGAADWRRHITLVLAAEVLEELAG